MKYDFLHQILQMNICKKQDKTERKNNLKHNLYVSDQIYFINNVIM